MSDTEATEHHCATENFREIAISLLGLQGESNHSVDLASVIRVSAGSGKLVSR